MQTMFEAKTSMPYDAELLERMKEKALALLQDAPRSQFTQAVVLCASSGNLYTALLPDALSKEKTEERALLARLEALDDTELCCILCMWRDACIDLPSFALRKMLCDMNSKNTESLLFVTGRDGVLAIPLSKTMS